MEVKVRGRPRVLTDEERIRNKTRYQLTKEWICSICKPPRNYTIAGKHSHLKTKKHHKAISDMLEDIVNDIKK